MVNVPFLRPRPYVPPPLTQAPPPPSLLPSAVIGDLMNYLNRVKEISKRILRDPKIKEIQERDQEVYDKVNDIMFKLKRVTFTSKTEENLVGTDKSALYYKMVEQVMENMAILQMGG